ncbi:hypothetical protein D9758_012342 [Tetrapyrgos nigripes]|uniref:Uncharacterized protein n=1 Tax=Tetrapyrgos nigripes TaxID=182062 RepID=A0A8H5FPQ5_9AGAR|nr:hypothetical protein D9758_012342 [Tetrapyrgos nigripes]
MIQYVGNKWIKTDKFNLFHGGAHYRSEDKTAQVVFNFTGTAFYFYECLWPFEVYNHVKLDDEDSVVLNLTDPDTEKWDTSDPLPPPNVPSDIRWQRTGLSDGQHTFTMIFGNYIVLDALVYTTEDNKDVAHYYDDSTSGSLQNVTVQESDPQIVYAGKGWNLNDPHPLYNGGNHASSTDVTASATFNFTGVAVYYHSSLWPFRVTTVLQLDDEPEEVLDLYDHSVPNSPGLPTVESIVRWGRASLTDGQHTLKITTGSNALVDAITYSKVLSDSTAKSSDPTDVSPGSTETASSDSGSHNSQAAIIGGAVGGSVGSLLILAALGAILFHRRQRNKGIRELSNPEPTSQWPDSSLMHYSTPFLSSTNVTASGPSPSASQTAFISPSANSSSTNSGYTRKGARNAVLSPIRREENEWEPPPPSYNA